MGKLSVWLSLVLVFAFGLTSSNSLEDFGNRFVRSTKKVLRKSEQACVEYGPGLQRKVFPSKYVLPGEYQHNAALGFEDPSKEKQIIWPGCNGVLISEYYVLTVAHCLVSPLNLSPVLVRLGNIDITGKEDDVLPQDITINQTIINPKFNRIRKEADIALIQLKEPAKIERHVQPACLYTKSDTPDNMVSVGWGRLGLRSNFSDLLLKSNVRTVNHDTCSKTYGSARDSILRSQICGILTEGDICHIGSGSSLFVPNGEDSRVTVVGLTSYGRGCSSVTPDIYTRIYNYLDWIEDIVWPKKM